MRPTRGTMALALALAASLASVDVRAQGSDQASAAQVLFDDALALMNAGEYAKACPKLEESQKLDPGMGTQFRLAECYEHIDRLATAWTLFLEVAEAAKRAGNADREDVSRKRAEALRPRLPMLTIHVSAPAAAAPGLEVRRDGNVVAGALWDRQIPVDAGAHRISARATGRREWEQDVTAVSGAVADVTVPALAGEGADPAVPVPGPDRSSERRPGLPTQRWLAIAAAGVGVAGVAIGTVFGLKASSTWDGAIGACDDQNPNRCSPTVQQQGRDALTQANVSTVGFAIGVAGLVGAGVLWFTAREPPLPSTHARGLGREAGTKPALHRVRLAPWLGESTAGATASGMF